MSELVELTDLQRLEVRPDMQIERDQVILFFKANYGWTEVFSAGNISTIIGKAKSRKTFFQTLLIAGLISNREVQFRSQLTGDVVLFDTEQGRFHVWRVSKRIEQIVGVWPSNLKIFGLRPLNTNERLNEIENYILQNSPQVVFIDGIRDLVTDINSAEQATDVVGKLMKWSYEKNCHICSILHQNKADDNARGHIGTEIVNKSETVLSVSKAKDKEFSLVKSEYTRGKETEEFQFTIDKGIPIINYEYSLPTYDNEKDEDTPF
jgi:RecA-family ATPase